MSLSVSYITIPELFGKAARPSKSVPMRLPAISTRSASFIKQQAGAAVARNDVALDHRIVRAHLDADLVALAGGAEAVGADGVEPDLVAAAAGRLAVCSD